MFNIYVPDDFYDEVAKATSEEWANSYLHEASLIENRLLPRTQTGWIAMCESKPFMWIIGSRQIRLLKPPLFHERPDQKAKKKRLAA